MSCVWSAGGALSCPGSPPSRPGWTGLELNCLPLGLVAISGHPRTCSELGISPRGAEGHRGPPPPHIPNALVLVAGKKVQFRKPAPGATDAVPSRKRATPINLASAIKKSSVGGISGGSGVSQRPFRDRVLHLLALRPYRKAELLLRLQKDGLAQADKDALDGLLQQVRACPGQVEGPVSLKWPLHRVWTQGGLGGALPGISSKILSLPQSLGLLG